ncbi:MAG: hypothetical protein J5770_07725 [Bacteroidaceae bacterium]|nr:hypothetical protein [Bacteroidaceae bacterium]
MNKKLLLLSVALLSFATSSFAQLWDIPSAAELKYETNPKVSIEANGKFWQGDSTFYFLYNVEADAFLSNNTCPSHAQWSTHAALRRDQANKIMLGQYRLAPIIVTDTSYVETVVTKTDPDTTYTETVMVIDTTSVTIPEWDGVTYNIIDWYNNRWWYVFPTSSYNTFVDNQGQADHMWNMKSMGDGIFRFSVSDLNPEFNTHFADSVFGGKSETYYGFNMIDPDYNADEEVPVMPLIPMLDVLSNKAYNPEPPEGEENLEKAELAISWRFIPEEEYLKYDSYRRAWNYIANGEIENFIADVEDHYGNKINTSGLYAILDSKTPVSYEEIMAAKGVVEQQVRDYLIATLFAGATNEEPANVTALMVNPNFDQGNKDGWDITSGIGQNLQYNYDAGVHDYTLPDGTAIHGHYNSETGAWIQGFIEAWHSSNNLGNGTISQTIIGLPAGKYSFSCDAIACRQSAGKQANVGVYLFAQGGDVNMQTSISTANEKPEHFEMTFVSSGGTIVLGLKSQNATANWMAADNFELWYYGEVDPNDDPYKVILEGTIASLEKKYPDVEGLMANNDVKDAYLAELETAKACEADYQTEDSVLNAAAAALAKSINDYVRMESLMAQVQSQAEAFEGTSFDGLSEILGEWYEMILMEAYNNGTADEAMIDSITIKMGEMIVDHITANVKPGDELTPLIKNPAFDTNFSGWSTTGATPQFGGKGGNADNSIGDVLRIEDSGCAEVFHNTFNMFQIVRNMPKGAFKLTAQAYERNDSPEGIWESEWSEGPQVGIHAVLYANNFESKVNHIMVGAQNEIVYAKAGTDGWPTDTYASSYDQYVPNSMDGANFYFNLGEDYQTYLVSVDFVLGHAGDSITIGLKNTFNSSWVIFDNFRLYYTGESLDALEEPVNSMLAKLDAVLADEESMYGADVAPMVESVRNELDAAYKGGDADGVFAALDKGNEAVAYAAKSAAAYESLTAAYDGLMGEYYAHEESEFSDERNAAVKELLDKADHALVYLDLPADEASELALAMKTLQSQLLLPEGGYIDLTADMFYNWTGYDASAEIVGSAGCAFALNQNTQMVYGDANVMYNNFADLTGADVLVLVATVGIPRLLFNRPDPPAGGSDSHGGTIPVELNTNTSNEWWTVTENEDGSRTYVVDVKHITEVFGYCHLNAIKGASWQDTNVTSIQIGYGIGNEPEAIESVNVEKKAAAGIYTITGAKVNTLQRGINILVDQNGNTRKVYMK